MSDRDELLGVRPEDLDDEARRRQAEWLRDDPTYRREHEEALALAGRLAALPGTGGPSFEALRARMGTPPAPANRPWWRWAAGGVAVAAAASIAVVAVTSSAGRDKGVDAGPAEVRLEAAAEGPGGALRPLADGAAVHADERVLFRATTNGHGFLRIDEVGGGSVWPAGGRLEEVGAGSFSPGGEHLESWRPDGRDGAIVYRAILCQDASGDPSSCSHDEITLQWVP